MQPQELVKRIKSGQAPIVFDVRSGFEYRNGHIPDALHAPTLKILLHQVRLPPDKNTEVVLTCEHGPRAQLAKVVLGFIGYRNVSLLEGHMAAWRQAVRLLAK